MSKDLSTRTISSLNRLLLNKKISAVELAKFFLEQAKTKNSITNSYLTFNPQATLNQAMVADEMIKQGSQTTLTGIPFSMKDAYATRDFTTTCASDVLRDFKPPYNATVYQKLLDIGSVLIGKNNQDAWGHGSSSENTDFGPVKNPWDPKRTAGGSSGGSAAALAQSTCIFAIAEDTGGSIRNPASFTNTCGLKVTYGRVSRYGAIAYASSLDTVGPMATNVEDLAHIMNHIAGFDPRDASSTKQPVPNYLTSLNSPLKGKSIGLVRQYLGNQLDPQVKKIVENTAKKFENLGAKIIDLSLPTLEYGVSIYYVIALSETSSNLARYDGVRYGNTREHFSTETKRRIMTGTFSLSSGYYDAFYKKALLARTQLIHEFDQAFEKVDALIGPVMPAPAPLLGEPSTPLEDYLADLYTCATNPAGIPSLAIPAGFSDTNLPIGIQLMGPMYSEPILLNLGHQFQQATDYHTQKPTSKIKN